MTIRYILRLRRQLAEARQENARIEGEVRSLEIEINGLNVENADVRAANTELRAEAQVAVERQVAAMETIDQLTARREQLGADLKKAIDWATEVARTNSCIGRDNDRLKTELAGIRQPVARVIPLQERGAA
ncbi:hypothetical protein [Streptomyces sp. NPDC015125]|uniref:hypothetical protein n=1 Tax=Streptomyces sp. NPDC015125 TaxID=3364938 RepID=UPI0037027374